MSRKESLKFNGTNYESWKNKMKTHLLCVGPGNWLVTKKSKKNLEEDDLKKCIEEQRDIFMCNIRTRKVVLSTLPKNEYNQVKFL